MKALVPTGRTDELVRYDDIPEPVVRPDEALIAVEAFSVNRGEMFLLMRPREGFLPGKDIAGTVIAAAADGSGPAIGTRVVGHPPRAGWAERVAVRTDSLAELPDCLDATTAAALPLAGLTALRLLRAAGSLAGRRILVTGASGGVGHYVVELATAAGAEMTAVSASEARGESLRGLGAEVVLDVADATGPFDIVLESVGGESTTLALAKLRKRGLLVWFGQASRQPATLSFFDFFAGPESATIRHFHYDDHDEPNRVDLTTLVRLTASGRLHPVVGRIADWAETGGILTDLRERRIRGKAVLRVTR